MSNLTDESSPAAVPSVLFLGNDLMFQSKISAACTAAGLKLIMQRNPKALAFEFPGVGTPTLVIVDLGLPNLDLASLVPSLRAGLPSAKLLGYGAHVLADRLDEADQSGFDAVVTRGQFDRDMSKILQSIAK